MTRPAGAPSGAPAVVPKAPEPGPGATPLEFVRPMYEEKRDCKTEYVHNPCFLSANILKILGVFAENQIDFSKHSSPYSHYEKLIN